MRRGDFRALWAKVAILSLLAGTFLPAGAASTAANPLAPQQNQAGPTTWVIYLSEQADLSPAYRLRDWDERGRFVLEALRETARRTQPAVLAALEILRVTGHISQVWPHYGINAIVVRGDDTAAQALARLPAVAAVYSDIPITAVPPVETGPAVGSPQAVEWNIQRIGAEQVWSTYGITGSGIVVANIDSGVEYLHPALVEQYRGNLGGGNFDHDYNWWDPTGQYDYPSPISGPYPLGSGHGTHTMGVIVGDDGLGNQIGVAPGARWIAAYGFSGIEGLLSAIEWTIAPWQVHDFDPSHPTADPTKRPHTVNNSWGAPGGMLLFEPLLRVQRAAGIFPTFAAGNNGLQGCGTMVAPGDNPAGFSVGATDASDGVAFFSSRGPNALRGWLGLYGTGPEVSAPGYPIRTSDPGGGYSVGGGTSYASPHVAGTVALLWAAEPDLIGRVEETAEILRGTALPRTSPEECGGVPGSQVPNNTFGWGRLDALAAVEMVWQAGTLAGTVTDAGLGAPVAGARVLMERNGHTVRTTSDAAGGYTFPLGQGTYTVTVQAYGYEPWTATGIAILQDVTTTLDVALALRPTHTLSGVVVEGAAQTEGDPVWAQVGLRDTPVQVTTDPASGAYSATVSEGTYLLRAVARGYVPENRTITVTGDLTESLALLPRRTYYLRDSRSVCGPSFQWVDATGGTPHSLGFQDFEAISIPTHPFTFYDSPHTTYYVSSNGFVSFGQGYPEHVQDLPQMVIPFEGPANDAIYAFLEVLNPAYGGQGTIYHQVVDNRYVVIEFYQVQHWVSGSPETFEFVLDTVSGAIHLQYLEVNRPDWATVGIENQDGSDGILYSYANSAGLTNSLAVAFYPIWGPPPADQEPAGVWGTLSGTVYVTGTLTPIPGTIVTATSFLQTYSTTADASGRYLFPAICADLYTLQAAAPGYYPGTPVPARLRWPDDIVVTDLFLKPQPAVPILTKTVAPTQVYYAETLTYTLALANEGEGSLSGAVLSDTLPALVGYMTSTPPGFFRDGTLTWTVDLPAGGSTAVTVVGYLIPPPAGRLAAGFMVTNTACLRWEGPAISASAAFEALGRPLAEPILTKTVAVTQALPGDRITYTLAYVNEGPADLYGAVLSDVLPLEVAYITSTPQGHYDGSMLTWTVDIAAGGTGQATWVGRLTDTSVPGTLVSNTSFLLWTGPALSSTASFQVGTALCQEVQDPSLSWSPLWPRVRETVLFTGTVGAGTPPITFVWGFGDGAGGEGPVVSHPYAAAGAYTVTLTAANACSQEEVRAGLVVTDYRVYLPLLARRE